MLSKIYERTALTSVVLVIFLGYALCLQTFIVPGV